MSRLGVTYSGMVVSWLFGACSGNIMLYPGLQRRAILCSGKVVQWHSMACCAVAFTLQWHGCYAMRLTADYHQALGLVVVSWKIFGLEAFGSMVVGLRLLAQRSSSWRWLTWRLSAFGLAWVVLWLGMGCAILWLDMDVTLCGVL